MMRILSLIRKIPLHHLLFFEIVVGLIGNILFLSLFIFFTDDVLEKDFYLYDQIVARFIYTLRTPFLTTTMKTISFIGDAPAVLLITVLIFGLLIYKKRRKEPLFLIFSLLAGGITNIFLKMIFHLPRPPISPLVTENDFSYPSGHAMNNLFFYGFLTFLFFRFTRNKKLSVLIGILAGFWIGLIGLSRIYLGVHYPSDIIAGYLAGFWLLLTALLIDKTITFHKSQ